MKEINMTTQVFKVVGITVHNGNAKVRFTEDMVRRVKQFTKGGATRCDFIELPNEMTKIEALKFMLTRKEFSSPEDQATIEETLYDKEREASKGEVRVKSKPSLDAIKSRPRKDVTVEDVLDAVNG
jgi:hypothetical protein